MDNLNIQEKKLLQEMFDLMQERLGDDLMERYDTRRPVIIRARLIQDVTAAKTLASKLNARFDRELVLKCAETYIRTIN